MCDLVGIEPDLIDRFVVIDDPERRQCGETSTVKPKVERPRLIHVGGGALSGHETSRQCGGAARTAVIVEVADDASVACFVLEFRRKQAIRRTHTPRFPVGAHN